MESEGSRPPPRPGHREQRLCAALSPDISATQVTAFGRAWLHGQGQRLLRIGARKDEPAQYLRGYFLSSFLISDMRFNSNTIRHFLASGDPAVFFIYFFSSRSNTFGHHCCYWQLPVAALNATGYDGMFTFPQLHCLWTVLNLTLIKHANNKRGSFFFFMNVTCLSWKDMLLILAFHLNQESNTKQKSI